MSRFKVRLAVALAVCFVAGVAALLWFVNRRLQTDQVSPIPAVVIRQKPKPPVGWQRFDGGEKFSFYLPPDLKEEEPPGNIDYVGPYKVFVSKSLRAHYLYVEKWNEELWRGRVSCDRLMGGSGDEPGPQGSEVEIDGRKATKVIGKIKEFDLVQTRVCFPDVGDGTFLTITVSYKDDRALDANQIISSIEFQ